MQDRFKFRVWSNIAKKYIKDFHAPIGNDYQLVLIQNGELCELGLGDSDEKNEHSWGSLKVFSDCIIEQCTGLKDKNGKLIYEGDIVKYFCDSDYCSDGYHKCQDCCDGEIAKIIFDNDSAMFKYSSLIDDCPFKKSGSKFMACKKIWPTS